MSDLDAEPTTRDRFWCAIYLRTLIESAMVGGAGRGVLQLLERFGVQAVDEYSRAQIEADDLDRLLDR